MDTQVDRWLALIRRVMVWTIVLTSVGGGAFIWGWYSATKDPFAVLYGVEEFSQNLASERDAELIGWTMTPPNECGDRNLIVKVERRGVLGVKTKQNLIVALR